MAQPPYEHALAGDFIDIDAMLHSGRYDRPAMLQLTERSDITFDRNLFADALAHAQLLDADDFDQYGLVGEDVDGGGRSATPGAFHDPMSSCSSSY